MNFNKTLAVAGILLPLAANAASIEAIENHCALAGMAAQATAAPAAFDEKTGKSPDHFPQPLRADFQHIRLELDFGELSGKHVEAREMLVFVAEWEDLHALQLDGVDLEIKEVLFSTSAAPAGSGIPSAMDFAEPKAVAWTYDGEHLSVAFDPPLPKGTRGALHFTYAVDDPDDGLNYIEPIDGDADPRWEVWSQGQTESNRHWMLAHDYPNDFMTHEVIATVRDPNVVSSGGELVEHHDNGDGSSTWHYVLDKPVVSYLISVVVGQFHIEKTEWHGIPVEYWVDPRFAKDAVHTFGRTPEMMEYFSKQFDEPFPWPRYAQVIVREFTAGGMENVGNTTMNSVIMQDENADKYFRTCGENREYIIAHELGHQWFGDLMTCRTWSHVWLDEGWADYCEQIWMEHACGREMYEYKTWENRNGLGRSDSVESNSPLVFVRTPSAGTTFFFNGGAAYAKGGYFLHMLREKLGDDAFWRGVARYIDEQKFSPVVTEDFRRALEEESGRDLEAFFRQWCDTPGTPHIDVSLDYDLESKQAVVAVEQTQAISDAVPAFHGPFDIYVRTADGTEVRETFELTDRVHEFRVDCPAPPAVFAPDPDGAFLMKLSQKVETSVLIETATMGPTTFSRCEAIVALGKKPTRRAVRALGAIAADEGDFYGARLEAVKILGGLSDDDTAAEVMAQVAAGTIEDWRVRRQLAMSLKGFDDEVAFEPLMKLVDDPADPVAAEAVESLGYFFNRRDESREAIMAAFDRRGLVDMIADNAINSMDRLDMEEAIEALVRGTGGEYRTGTRASAADSIGNLLVERVDDHPEAVDRLIELAGDKRRRVRGQAIGGLGVARAKLAVTRLEQLATRSDDEGTVAAARAAIAQIKEEPAAREDVAELRGAVKDLQVRLDEMEGEHEEQEFTPEAQPQKKRKKFLGIF